MNNLIRAVLLSCALSAPVAAFAQTADHALTRADVVADLIQAERDGTLPTSNWDYPPSAPTIAMLLPLTYTMHAVPALLMLAGIFYGSQYGGAIGAILLNLP
ncbi:DUF4148 domain-containing protein, partial [Burkholderia sp. Tr-20390]|uniref:DUF4148 domain-containing protein n=1 Tax=Burkholderia sp. Tr-20390 TaxID=2703904 RepID=UPI001F1234A2